MKTASVYKGTAYMMRAIPTWMRKYVFPSSHEIADNEGAGVVEEVSPAEDEGTEGRFKVGDEVIGVSFDFSRF